MTLHPSSINWYLKPNGKTAHLFREAGRYVSWCGNVKISRLEQPWNTAPDSGFKLCKACQKLAKEKLGIK